MPTSANHGGRRPGAGAPKGNLNALKTGTRSKQLRAVIAALILLPETRRLLVRLASIDNGNSDQLATALRYYAALTRLSPEERGRFPSHGAKKPRRRASAPSINGDAPAANLEEPQNS